MSHEFEVESIRPLVAAAKAGGTLNAEVDQALAALEQEINHIAAELQVEHVGPGVGMADMNAEHVYRLVIRQHEIDVTRHEWSLWVCDALDNCDFRATWPVTGAGRLRRKQVTAVVPELVTGYRDAVVAAGKGDTPAGQRLEQMAGLFS
ncbi:hypothetical protein TK90_0394 [Thioalkalivibrio sp. K90mix]|uniref:hypothetical protein n=1 Tax=unclassified Thioalkalivibrio TaxID=2621013 RepID=UPI000195A738|nr:MULTISPECIES: hypothetical protein [unclassified Thioalkalivibrio]ADC70909.1 hypothetical protein TK90_0394 [Thioalkalivibrio sp. K90mix]